MTILEDAAGSWPAPINEWQGQLLRQRLSRDVIQKLEGGTDLATEMANAATSESGNLPVHQWVLQHPKTPFISGPH